MMPKSLLLLMLVLGLLVGGCSKSGSDDAAVDEQRNPSEQLAPLDDEDPVAEDGLDPGSDADDPGGPITPLEIADGSVYFESGLTGAGLATAAAQLLRGQLADPDSSDVGFSGAARLNLNGRFLSLSPYLSGAAWLFDQNIELAAGLNTLSLEVRDRFGRLCSYWGPRQFFSAAANLAVEHQYQIEFGSIDLSAYPAVSLNVNVTYQGQAVSGLSLQHFAVINAHVPTRLGSCTVTGAGAYRLGYTDHLAGARRVWVYAAQPSADQTPTRAGLSAPGSYGRNFALLVGINDYPEPYNDLNNCLNDVADMQAALAASSWACDGNQIVQLTNAAATRAAILNRLGVFMQSLTAADVLLFHFSGHGSGSPDDSESNQYLCTVDAGAQWLSVSDLSAALDTSHKGLAEGLVNVFVMLDSCHSGNFIARSLAFDNVAKFLPLPDNLQSRGDGLSFARDLSSIAGGNIFVMTACLGDEVAYDVGSLANGAFTHYLTKSLGLAHATRTMSLPAGAPANLAHDALVSGEEAYAWLWPLLVNSSYAQTPQMSDNATTPASLIMRF